MTMKSPAEKTLTGGDVEEAACSMDKLKKQLNRANILVISVLDSCCESGRKDLCADLDQIQALIGEVMNTLDSSEENSAGRIFH